MRYVGVDLHSNNFTVCYRSAEGEQSCERFALSQIKRFRAELRTSDTVAVEATATTRWFVNQISSAAGRVRVVNPRRFEVIAKSCKKTDAQDARTLAEFCSLDMLPTVRHKSDECFEAQKLCGLRTSLVEMRTRLFNQMHSVVIGAGRQETKRSVKSALGRKRLLAQGEWSVAERLQLEILSRQIEHLESGIKEAEAAIEAAGEKLAGYENLLTIKGIGCTSATLFAAVIGDIAEFETAQKLSSYLGVVPRVSNSNEKVCHGRITKQGNKAARTALVQCALVAKKLSPFLQEFYRRIRERRGAGKAKLALARKFLTIIYQTLKNNWRFTDFANFVKAEN